MLFVDVSEVKIKISHRGLTGIAHGFHIFDNRRTVETSDSIIVDKQREDSTNQSILFPEPATNKGCHKRVRRRNGTGAYVFHEPRGMSRNWLTSIPYTSYLRKTRSSFPGDGRCTRYCDS